MISRSNNNNDDDGETNIVDKNLIRLEKNGKKDINYFCAKWCK